MIKSNNITTLLSIFDESHDMIIIFDREGRIIDANQEALKVLRYSKSHLINQSISSVVDYRDQSKIFDIVNTNKNNTNVILQNSEGDEVHVEINIKREVVDSNNLYFLFAKNISEIVVHEERFRTVFDENPLPLSISRVDDGVVFDVNKQFVNFFEINKSEIIGKTFEKVGIYDKHQREILITEYKKNKGRISNFSSALNVKSEKRSGLIFWETTVYNDQKAILAAFVDNTEVKKRSDLIESTMNENDNTKKAILNILEDVEVEKDKSVNLAKELNKFKLAVDQASDHIIMTDVTGNIIYANQAVETITGYDPAKIIGFKPGNLWGGLMPKSFYEKFWDVISKKKVVFNGEFTNKKKSGEIYISESSVTPILDKNGAVEFYLGIERDITKLKEIDRMKSEFISIASHQLRTPLSAMKWYLELLLNGDVGELNDQLKDFIQNINTSNERMIDLVNSLLNVSRIESGRLIVEPKRTSFKKLISEIKSEIIVKIKEKSMKLEIDIDENLPLVKMDPRLIRNAILNLLSNAIKYSPIKKTINIRVKLEAENARIEIQDHGYGIPEGDKAKVFTKFYRGKNILTVETNGNGIGLYLVKSIIETSGGKIWFESKQNIGTTFSFTLPIKGVTPKKGEVVLEDTF